MNVFWRDTPLNAEESELYRLVLEAHHNSALRGNASTQAIALAAAGSGDYFKALAAGLMTLGDLHGPIEETVNFLLPNYPEYSALIYTTTGRKIPGWGNSFIKGSHDPLWEKVDMCLRDHFPKVFRKLHGVTETLHFNGKDLYPNPSAYTAAAAIVLGIPANIAACLMVAGRLAAWTQLAADNLRAK